MSLRDRIRFIFSETACLALLCSILREVYLHSGLLETGTSSNSSKRNTIECLTSHAMKY